MDTLEPYVIARGRSHAAVMPVPVLTDHYGLAAGIAIYAVAPIAILVLLIAEWLLAGRSPSPAKVAA